MSDKMIEELREGDRPRIGGTMKDEFEKWLESQWDDENDDSIMVSCGKQEMLREVFANYRSIRASAVAVEPLAVISQLCRRAFETSKAHGWKHDNDGQEIALMHSELSEALEAIRKPGKKDEHLPDLDPVGLEMADVLIRIFDYCGARGIDLATCVKEKMDYNDNRPFKHGGKAF